MTTPSNQLPNPTGWHRKPRGTRGPCSICGILSAQPGEHRATADSESVDAIWIKRRRYRGDWRYTDVGSRQREAEQDAPLGEISAAVTILAHGGSLISAAQKAGVSIGKMRQWTVCFAPAWGQAFAAALRAIEPTDWHNVPRGFELCPVCGCEGNGEHRLDRSDPNKPVRIDRATSKMTMKELKAKPRGRSSKPRGPRGPGVEVVKGMSVATFALATGSSLGEAAKIANVSYSAMRDWKRSYPGQWEALYSAAMKQVVETVRTVAGTDAVLNDPDRVIKQAAACEKWIKQRGETLFPASDDRPTLNSFYCDYFQPNCLIDAKKVSIESYEQVVRQWVRLTGDPPLEEITVAMLAKFRECQSRMRGRKPGSRKSPNSVRTVLRHLQTILDKTGEPQRRNRDAAGILAKVPYIKPPKEVVRAPKIARLDQIDAVYAAAVATELPRIDGFKPPAWWRALLVVALNTALRRRTLFELRMADVRWEDRCIVVDPKQVKNSVGGVVPLNDTTLAHLRAIRTDREMLFPWPYDLSHFHTRFHKLQDAAGIPLSEHFGLHSIRKLAATQLWEHSPAIAQLTLGHASLQTTRKHYVAGGDMLRKAIDQMPQPASFTSHDKDTPIESQDGDSVDGSIRAA
jgi:integrase